MKMLSSLKRNLMIATVVSMVCFSLVQSGVAHADIRTQAIVTVYSEGKVMAVYKAVDRGRMDDDCYVFTVRKGARDLEVRVCGTFTVEQLR